ALTWPSDTAFRMVSLRGFIGVIQKCQLETQDSAGNWKMIPDTLFNAEFTGSSKVFLFAAPITTKAVRFFIQYTNSDTNVPGLSEFEVYNPPIITVTPPPTVVLGDVNGDGKLGITDVVLALRIVAGIVTATPANTAAGDIDKSGAITITDVVKMLRAVAGIAPLG
ncbi:MAG TPA: dockerin type I repeat-containing protein, partial [Armatimonadota bacterium]